jgi:DNA-dependent RNA polymerase auxiliary subunit epsilon
MAVYKNINIRAVRSFKNMFKDIDNEAWYVMPGGYRATFNENGIVHFVTYNQKGSWESTKRQYCEIKMDHDIRALVKSVYYDYNITLVEDIEQPSKPVVYLVHMEDQVSVKNIRICEGEMRTVLDANKF